MTVNSSQLLIYPSSKSVIEYRQQLEELTKYNGLSEVEAAQEIHKPIEQKQLILISDSPVVKLQLAGSCIVDGFNEKENRMQRVWTKPSGLAGIQTVLLEEARDLRQYEKLLEPSEEAKKDRRRFAR